jgi:hypothetical protein
MPFPVDIQFVRQAEAKLGRSLPLGYVGRMCRDNGGQVRVGADSFSLYPILDTTDRKRLARTCNDILRETASAREWRGFPAGALAIGHNGAGDKLVLLPAPDSERFEDSVYWWDHETGKLHVAVGVFDEPL